MSEKYEYYTKEAEVSLEQVRVDNPELNEAFMLRGIGHALLAIAHELRVIERMMKEELKE